MQFLLRGTPQNPISSMAGVPNHVPGGPNTACFPCPLNQTHLIQIISSLVETPRPELGVSDKGEMQNVGGPPGTWLGTTVLWEFIAISTEEDPTQNAIFSNNNKLITLNVICTAPNHTPYESIQIMSSYTEIIATIVAFGKRTPEREQEHALRRASFGLQKSSAALYRTC